MSLFKKFISSLLPKLFSLYRLQICLNYFATSHGKGPNDDLGGNVKCLAHRQVSSRQTVITDAQTFTEAVKCATSKILTSSM